MLCSGGAGVVDVDVAHILQFDVGMIGEVGQVLAGGEFSAADLCRTKNSTHDLIPFFIISK